MATVSVVTLAALTAYIVVGLLMLARVPDPGGPARRLVELAFWPAVAVRTAASPSRRRVGPAPADVVRAAVAPAQWQAAATVPPGSPAPATAPPLSVADESTPDSSGSSVPAAAPADPTPEAVPEAPPRDARREWERFVLRLTELDD